MHELEKNRKGFICNLGTGTGSSVLEVIDSFEKANAIRIPYEFAPRRPGDVTEAWADPTYAKKKVRVGVNARSRGNASGCMELAK